MRKSKQELNQIVADAERARRRKQMEKRPKPTPISPVILAVHPGTCERCGQPIRPGQAIVKARFWDRIEEWVHSLCSLGPDDPVVPAVQAKPVMADNEPRPARLLADGTVSIWLGPGRAQIITRRHPHYDLLRRNAEAPTGRARESPS